MPGIGEGFLAVEDLLSFFQRDQVILLEGPVFVLFREVQLHIHFHAAQGIHDVDQGLEIHLGIVVDFNPEGFLQPEDGIVRPVIAQMGQFVRSIVVGRVGDIAVPGHGDRRHGVVDRVHHDQDVHVAASVNGGVVSRVDPCHIHHKGFPGNVQRGIGGGGQRPGGFILGDGLCVLLQILVLFLQQVVPRGRQQHGIDRAIPQVVIKLAVVAVIHILHFVDLGADLVQGIGHHGFIRPGGIPHFFPDEIRDLRHPRICRHQQVHFQGSGRSIAAGDGAQSIPCVVDREAAEGQTGAHDHRKHPPDPGGPAHLRAPQEQDQQDQVREQQDDTDTHQDLDGEHAHLVEKQGKEDREQRGQSPQQEIRPLAAFLWLLRGPGGFASACPGVFRAEMLAGAFCSGKGILRFCPGRITCLFCVQGVGPLRIRAYRFIGGCLCGRSGIMFQIPGQVPGIFSFFFLFLHMRITLFHSNIDR